MGEDPKQMMWMLIALLVGSILLLAVLAKVITRFISGPATASRFKLKEAWTTVANRMGFDLIGGPGLKGMRRGRAVDARIETEGAVTVDQRHQKYYTRIQVALGHRLWREGVKIKPRGALAKLEKAAVGEVANLERQPIVRTGDGKFDRDFMVSGRVTEPARRALGQPAVHQALRGLNGRFDWYEIKLGELIVEIDHGIANEDQLARHIDRCVDAADRLDDAIDGDDVGAQGKEELFPSYTQ